MGLKSYSKCIIVVSLICTQISGEGVYTNEQSSPSQNTVQTTMPYIKIQKNSSGNSNDTLHGCPCEPSLTNCSHDAICTNNSKQEVPFDYLYEMKVFTFITNYYFYFSNIPVFFTNPMTLVLVYNMKSFQTTELYIVWLSINDFLVCLLRFTNEYLYELNFDWNNYLCRMFHFGTSASLVLSNYILTCWTVERMCAVLFPLKLSVWFTLKRVKCFLGILICWSALWTVPYLTEVSSIIIDVKTATNYCKYSLFLTEIWHRIENIYYVIIPLVVITTCNITIMFEVAKQTKERVNMTSNQNIIDKKRQDQTKLTLTLIATSITFVVLHIPYCLTLIWYSLYPNPEVIYTHSPRDYLNFFIYTTLAFAIADIQNWINFFVYILAGKKFRSALRHMFCSFRNHGKTLTEINLSSQTQSTSSVTR